MARPTLYGGRGRASGALPLWPLACDVPGPGGAGQRPGARASLSAVGRARPGNAGRVQLPGNLKDDKGGNVRMSIGNALAGTVFTPEYLAALELEASEAPAEAELAGPWTIHPVGDLWAVSAEGQPEELTATSPEIALLAAAFLPGIGREP